MLPEVDEMRSTSSAPTPGWEVDNLTFSVRARKFRVTATVIRRSSITLSTEFGLRMIHLVPNLSAEDLGAFFGFSAAETRVLIEDILDSGLGELSALGTLRLSQRGLEAASSITDTFDIFDLEDIRVAPSFDLISFAPIDEAEPAADVARLVEELPIVERERAARSVAAATDAFGLHFNEWKQQYGRRYGLDEDTRVYLVENVQPVKTFGAPVSVSIRRRVGEEGVAPDFSELFSLGRTGSRDDLVNALRSRIQRIPVANDFDAALATIEAIDDGLFRRSGIRSSTQQDDWMALAQSDAGLPSSSGPGLRLAGSTSSESVRSVVGMVAHEPQRGRPERSTSAHPVVATLTQPLGPRSLLRTHSKGSEQCV